MMTTKAKGARWRRYDGRRKEGGVWKGEPFYIKSYVKLTQS